MPLVFAAALAIALTGGSVALATTAASPSEPRPLAAAGPPDCLSQRCRQSEVVTLAHGYAIALWLTPETGTAADYAATPHLELLRDNVAVQWLSPLVEGPDAWDGQLTCETKGKVQDCALVGTLGAHSGYGGVVVLRAGRLVTTPADWIVTSSAGVHAADLDHDGYLDLEGPVNDYKPDYADGTNYWQTLRFTANGLASTGCEPEPASGSPAPTALQTGACPTTPAADVG
jgi:hypothetical protein